MIWLRSSSTTAVSAESLFIMCLVFAMHLRSRNVKNQVKQDQKVFRTVLYKLLTLTTFVTAAMNYACSTTTPARNATLLVH